MYYIVQDNERTIENVYDDNVNWIFLLHAKLSKYNTIHTELADKPGYYLIQDNDEAKLICKSLKIAKGYIYNSVTLETTVVSTFRRVFKGHLDISSFVRLFEEPFSVKSLILLDHKAPNSLVKALTDHLCKSECVTAITEDRSKYSGYHTPMSSSMDDLEKRLLGKGCVLLDIPLSENDVSDIINMPREVPLIIVYQKLASYARHFRYFDYIIPYQITEEKDKQALNYYTCELPHDLKGIIDSVNKSGQLIIASKSIPTFYKWIV